MRKLLPIALMAIMIIACCGFTLAPSRYHCVISPGESVSIPYNIEGEGNYLVSYMIDDAFNPLPEEWLRIPDEVDDDFVVKLSVPKNANPDNYSAFISVKTTEGMIRTELCSRLLVAVSGEPVTRSPWLIPIVIAVVVTAVLIGAAYIIRRRRYA